MAPKKSRDVYKGSDKEMVEKLMPLAKQKGVEFIDYDENPVISKAKLDKEKIEKCHDVLKIMHELHNKLNFPKKQTEKVFHSIAASMKKKWKLDDEQVKDWGLTMAARFRNVGHVAGKGKLTSKWVRLLPWNAAEHGSDESDEDAEDEESEEEDGKDNDDDDSYDEEEESEEEEKKDEEEDSKKGGLEPNWPVVSASQWPAAQGANAVDKKTGTWEYKAGTWEYGFDREIKLGYRRNVAKPKLMNWSIPPKKPKEADDNAFMVITFDDGDEKTLDDAIWADCGADKRKVFTEPPWSKEHAHTHNKLTISQRTPGINWKIRHPPPPPQMIRK